MFFSLQTPLSAQHMLEKPQNILKKVKCLSLCKNLGRLPLHLACAYKIYPDILINRLKTIRKVLINHK